MNTSKAVLASQFVSEVKKTRTKRVPKRQPTKELLIDVGEHLFGLHGVAGISLREIAAFAGLSSNNIVQYHFGDKEGLIQAIMEDRVARMVEYREQLFEDLQQTSLDARRIYLMLMWLPRMSFKGDDGSHSFCRFLLQLCVQPERREYPLLRYYDEEAIRKQVPAEGADLVVDSIIELRSLFPGVPRELFDKRLSVLNQTHLMSVVTSDNARIESGDIQVPAYDIDFMIDFAIGALAAPENH